MILTNKGDWVVDGEAGVMKGGAFWEGHWPDDDKLLKQVIRNVFPSSNRGKRPMWAYVMDRFAVGSSVAIALCRRYGFDPDATKGV